MATPQTLNLISDILKDKYEPALDNQLSVEPDPFLEKIRKTPLTNNIIKSAAPVGISGGFGFGDETANETPDAGPQMYEGFTVSAVDMYANIEISEKTIRLASSDQSAMINALQREIKGAYEAAKWNVARSLFGDGTGKLCTFATNVTNKNEITVNTVKFLKEGLIVDIYDGDDATAPVTNGSKRRIVSIDRVNKKVKFSGAANISTTDADTAGKPGFITVQNSYNKEIVGLGAIFDSGVTSLYGVTKTDAPWIAPEIIDANNDLTDKTLYEAVSVCADRKGSRINFIMMGDEAFSAYYDYMLESNVRIVKNVKYIGGSAGFSMVIGNSEIEIVKSSFVPEAEVWGVDTNTFKFENSGWKFADYNGSVFSLMEGKAVHRALLANYGNLLCDKPGGCFKIINADATA